MSETAKSWPYKGIDTERELLRGFGKQRDLKTLLFKSRICGSNLVNEKSLKLMTKRSLMDTRTKVELSFNLCY